ncbi:complement factor H-like isoform X2 [Neoarius graeffei]|uniref:complement factor H-like isoform X2 n=1 Tax=Neoarius graeffei TaxID=443677 RepID=UPI00298D28D7|nr:complement factor H-like isoform X2 [Neoarius graeffei]
MLRYIVIISVLLMMAVNVQAQCGKPAVGENMILIDGLDQQTFPNGSSVKVKCSIGYIPERASASRSMTCTGTQWSDLALQCKKRSCGNPGEIPNGKYLFPEGILFGATITAQCNEGYRLIGTRATRNCRESGWDGRNPTCEVVKCEKPPTISGGVFEPDLDAYDYGEGVTYHCNRGLDLIGSSVISCSGDGTFQPLPPQCRDVSCERLVIPNSSRIGGKSPPYKYNNFVQYQCDEGYRMEGSGYLTCKENGWDPPPPRCIEITCDSPSIRNAVIDGSSSPYRYGVSVQIRCTEGYRVEGSGSLTCGEDGWKAPLPQCVEITCDSPSIRNAVISGSSSPYRYGVSVQIRCTEGYRVEGSGSLTCGEDGWKAPLPQCVEMTCDAPNINNAFIVGRKSSYSYNMSIQYKCNKGYRMEGSGRLTCEENGWNLPSPKCNIVTCLKPPVITNGLLNPPKDIYEYGETVTYSCRKGFTLDGDSTVSCTDDGNFQPSPQCLETFCSEPQIENGFIFEGGSTSYGYKSSVRVQCNTGYKMEGSDYLTCEENEWNPPLPKCNNQILIPILIVLGLESPALCRPQSRSA